VKRPCKNLSPYFLFIYSKKLFYGLEVILSTVQKSIKNFTIISSCAHLTKNSSALAWLKFFVKTQHAFDFVFRDFNLVAIWGG